MFEMGFYLFSFFKMFKCVFTLVYNEIFKCLYFVFIFIILDTSSHKLCF